MRCALVEQFVYVAAGRFATMLADRPTHRGQEPQLGVDGLLVAHERERARPTGAAQFTPRLLGEVNHRGSSCVRLHRLTALLR